MLGAQGLAEMLVPQVHQRGSDKIAVPVEVVSYRMVKLGDLIF